MNCVMRTNACKSVCRRHLMRICKIFVEKFHVSSEKDVNEAYQKDASENFHGEQFGHAIRPDDSVKTRNHRQNHHHQNGNVSGQMVGFHIEHSSLTGRIEEPLNELHTPHIRLIRIHLSCLVDSKNRVFDSELSIEMCVEVLQRDRFMIIKIWVTININFIHVTSA